MRTNQSRPGKKDTRGKSAKHTREDVGGSEKGALHPEVRLREQRTRVGDIDLEKGPTTTGQKGEMKKKKLKKHQKKRPTYVQQAYGKKGGSSAVRVRWTAGGWGRMAKTGWS